MPAHTNIGDFVGISTNVMTGVDIWEAAALTKQYGLCLQLEPIIRKLRKKGRVIPMVSEICEPTAEQAVATVAKTRQDVMRYWAG